MAQRGGVYPLRGRSSPLPRFSSQNPNPVIDVKPPTLANAKENIGEGWEIIDVPEPETEAIDQGNTYSRIHGQLEVSLGWGNRRVKVLNCQFDKCVFEN